MGQVRDIAMDALMFASGAHAAISHKRKYTGEDYIVHPIEVAMLVRYLGAEIEAAALLHDVVEDTGVTNELVLQFFGATVAKYVEEMTDVSRPEDGSRAARKQKDLEHLALASFGGKSIKLADLISNSRSIVEHDKAFALIYLAEKEALLKVLVGGCPLLHETATKQLADAKRKLGI